MIFVKCDMCEGVPPDFGFVRIEVHPTDLTMYRARRDMHVCHGCIKKLTASNRLAQVMFIGEDPK